MLQTFAGPDFNFYSELLVVIHGFLFLGEFIVENFDI